MTVVPPSQHTNSRIYPACVCLAVASGGSTTENILLQIKLMVSTAEIAGSSHPNELQTEQQGDGMNGAITE